MVLDDELIGITAGELGAACGDYVDVLTSNHSCNNLF